jgi:glycosyltransferase involved in cell wall biosynthesis
MTDRSLPLISVVIIGRNEGDRLVECLQSVFAAPRDGFRLEVLYVDSASTDGSPQRASVLGANVIVVQPRRPSAAIGRNAGWRAARGDYILFLDGDTLLHPGFVPQALAAMSEPDVAIVWGHRRERFPQQSLYVRVLDLDWVYPAGESEFCGGDALMRRAVLAQTGGFDDTLIAGEEPELCRRIREQGHRILHIDAPMTTHDLAITRFSAYWRRAFRAGHAYAEVANRYRDSDDRFWLAEARGNLARGSVYLASPAVFVAALALYPQFALGMCIAAAGLLTRSAHRSAWKSPDRTTRWLYAVHSHVQQVPIMFGQLAWRMHRFRGHRRALIEYKQANMP